MDSQGAGPTLSLSMPILNTMENGSGLLGVAAVDILFKQIARILPETEQMYAFIVDNNGIAIYHPHLKVPVCQFFSIAFYFDIVSSSRFLRRSKLSVLLYSEPRTNFL
ncbi:unnamed protein product [Gongylonema pulchrum]|uniref:Cache domain-containing protein n=1 Tax=Gongylonema pulchrum TaxID=637853 RepID=A0A183DVJ7_9BILA|nr:unnamed protein product [Gongylonema pulchrum]